jgi:carbamoyltransferase
MNRFYVGLATTKHDPAVAVIDSSGELLFAEASERYLQDKRAPGAAADVRHTVSRIIEDYGVPDGGFVIAKSWSRGAHRVLDLLYLLGMASHERLPGRSRSMTRYLESWGNLFGTVWMQHCANKLSGGHFADLLARHGNGRVSFVGFPHHLAHAASGCFTSPFEQAACMVIDGQGELGSITYFEYEDGRIRTVERMRGAESLGILYAYCTNLCGFDAEKGEEWKLMGLAPYGTLHPEIYESLRSLVRVNGLTFRYPSTGNVRRWMTDMQRWARPKGAPPLEAADLAFTTQYFYAEVMDHLLSGFYDLGISDNLVLVGGCALNSAYNGGIVGRTGFKHLHVPSAPADDGTALGAALLAYRKDHPGARPAASVRCPYRGTAISDRSLSRMARVARVRGLRHVPDTLIAETADLLARGKLVGWIQGRAEFGPRALGNRSILADPRDENVKDRINSVVKFREEFRPLAPSVLDEFGAEYFEGYQMSPFMERTFVFRDAAAAKVPGVVHVDGTGRPQSVRREWNERFYDLICAFHERTGVPLLLNTSFNVIGKPIVHSLEDALGLFYTTGLDALVVEDYIIEK